MSRRGCVKKIDILPDGSITKVEMTSLGFQDSLNPYEITQAETACVLKGPGNIMITELDIFTRAIINITSDSVMGWKYFDFGDDYTDDEYMYIAIKMQPLGCGGKIHIYADSDTPENEIGVVTFSNSDHILKAKVKKLTGRHAIYMKAEHAYRDIWSKDCFEQRALFNLIAFVFMK